MSYLFSKGYPCELVDCRELIYAYKTNDILPLIARRIGAFKPDVIGINILTAAFEEAKRIAAYIKQQYPHILIIVGGVHPSVEPELTFRQNECVDAIGIGPGEEVCLDIVEGKALNEIAGLMRRGAIEEYSPRKPEQNLDKYPFLNYKLVNHEYYASYSINTTFDWLTKSLGALTSRGCPFSCKFCGSRWSKPFRAHSAEYVVELAKYLARFDINTISFWDDTIGFSEGRLHKICEGFAESGLFLPKRKLRWFALLRVNQVKPDLLRLMKSAGCVSVAVGIESGSDRMLKMIDKKSTVELNRQACRYIQEAGLILGTSYMIGIPGETETDMEATLAFMREVSDTRRGFGYFRPLPGSRYYRDFTAEGLLRRELVDWTNLGNFSVMSKYNFSQVDTSRYYAIMRRGVRIVSDKHWIGVHEDIAAEVPDLIEEISDRYYVRVARVTDHGTVRCHAGWWVRLKGWLKMAVPEWIRDLRQNRIYQTTGVYPEARVKRGSDRMRISHRSWIGSVERDYWKVL